MAVIDSIIYHMVVILATLNGICGQIPQSRAYKVKEYSSEDGDVGYYGPALTPTTAADGGFHVNFEGLSSFFDKSDSVGFGDSGFVTGGTGGFPSIGFFPFEIESRNSRGGLKPLLPSSTFWMGPPPALTTGPGYIPPVSEGERPPQHSGEGGHSEEEDGPSQPDRDWSREEDSPGSVEESSRQYSSGEESDDGAPPPTGAYGESPSTLSSQRGPPPSPLLPLRRRPHSPPRQYSANRQPPNPLRPYYKTVGPTKPPQINKSYLRPHHNGPPGGGSGKLKVHQHSFGIRHDPQPLKSDTPYYSGNSQRRSQSSGSRNQKSNLFFNFPSSGWDEFRPSPRDPLQDDLDRFSDVNDFTPEHSHVKPKKVKSEKEPPQNRTTPCVKSNKTVTTRPDVMLECYICTDGKTGKIYEECTEEKSKPAAPQRKKREANSSTSKSGGREKREYEYSSEEYQPTSLRRGNGYGPDHFSGEDMSVSYEEDSSFERDSYRDRDSEKCSKKKKGGMICISCENMKTGGTYEQCSYASDPKKNSYETSYSKSYGSSRGKEGDNRQPGSTKRRAQSRKPTVDDESSIASDSPSSSSSPTRGSLKRRKSSNKDQLSREVVSERIPPRPAKRRGASRKQYSASTRNGPTIRENFDRWTAARRSQPSTPAHVPPPSSRAYSTPPPMGPDPFSVKLPDPYNPPDVVSVDLGYDEEDDVPPPSSREHYRSSSKNRKYDDFDADYDSPFNFFPSLPSGDSDPISLAPHVEYDDETSGGADIDYPLVPSRRVGQDQGEYSMTQSQITKPLREETVEETKKSYDYDKNNASFNQRHNNVTCKKVKKDNMMCLQCSGLHGTRSEECMYVAESEPKSKTLSYGEQRSLNNHEQSKRNESRHFVVGPNQNEPRGFQQSTPRGVGSHHPGDYQRNNGHHDVRLQPSIVPHLSNYQQNNRIDHSRPHQPPSPSHLSHVNYPNAENQAGHYQQNAQASDTLVKISDRGKRKFKKYSTDESNKKSFGDKEVPTTSDTQARSHDIDKQPSPRMRINQHANHYNISRNSHQDYKQPNRNDNANKRDGGEGGAGLTRRHYNPVSTDPPTFHRHSTAKPRSEKGGDSVSTELTFDPVLGMSLPRYMVTKSKHGAIFDEVSPSG